MIGEGGPTSAADPENEGAAVQGDLRRGLGTESVQWTLHSRDLWGSQRSDSIDCTVMAYL